MMERCGKCGMVEESSIHDINSPDTEIRRVAHHFELVAPCPRCAIKDAALAAANAELTRLRETIGWAESHAKIYAAVGGYRYVDFASELRRRASGKGRKCSQLPTERGLK